MRPLNHTGLDRHTSWAGRQDQRLRPGSAGALRTYDDKPPFLTQNLQIGRNFDEDERKPLEGGFIPRRTVSDEDIPGGVPLRQDPKSDHSFTGNAPAPPATTPLSQFPGGATSGSYAVRFSEVANVSGGRSYVKSEGRSLGSGNLNLGVENNIVSGPSQNAWGPRKVAVGISEPVAASWSVPDAATKLAHASALEKVSSGRWLSNQNKQIDVEVIRHPEPESKVQSKGNAYTTFSYGSTDVPDVRSLSINDRMPMTSAPDAFQVQPPLGAGTHGGSDVTERPRLKLLPRSKPVDNLEPLVAHKQVL